MGFTRLVTSEFRGKSYLLIRGALQSCNVLNERWETDTYPSMEQASLPKNMKEKKSLFSPMIQHRFGGLVLFGIVLMAIALVTRLALLAKAAGEVSWDLSLMAAFGWGLVFDLGAVLWWSLPVALALVVLPSKFFSSRIGRWSARAGSFVVVGLMLFSAVSEWTFWDEFEVRFNFIAVDYLVYTTEVIANIQESYPMPLIIGGIVIGATLGLVLLHRLGWLAQWTEHAEMGWKRRYGIGLGLLVAMVGLGSGLAQNQLPNFANNYNRELAKNGNWALFAAFRNNQLEYDQFYRTLPTAQAFARVQECLTADGSQLVDKEKPDTLRQIVHEGPELRPNVIQITVESLSASFMARYGSEENIMPHLDGRAGQSLVFDRFYATGTRTVRGMEALTLSLPPTPGRSLVKRPNNEGLFSLGSVFRSKGYDTAFIYGGYGYFDNMNHFFGENGYRVVDRTLVPDEEITFSNAWGACDEDLLDWTLREADAAAAEEKPFFHFVMTTSNHRPFTYPAGRIDLPSKEAGRAGGVKYTDYAIERFLAEAATRPWYNNTIFVIVSDHCASSAGKTALPVANYHVPLIVFSPGGQVKPGVVDTLMSQVDFAPTLLGMLNWSYPSRFYGRDVLDPENMEKPRAFIGTYQKVGLLQEGKLAVLSPVRQAALYIASADGEYLVEENSDSPLVRDAVAFYQSASDFYQRGAYHAVSP